MNPHVDETAGNRPPIPYQPPYQPPSVPFVLQMPPPQRHSHTLTNPFRDGFLLGLGFIVASFIPLGALVVLIVTLAGIGSASAGIH